MENERELLCFIGCVLTFLAYAIGLIIGYNKAKREFKNKRKY